MAKYNHFTFARRRPRPVGAARCSVGWCVDLCVPVSAQLSLVTARQCDDHNAHRTAKLSPGLGHAYVACGHILCLKQAIQVVKKIYTETTQGADTQQSPTQVHACKAPDYKSGGAVPLLRRPNPVHFTTATSVSRFKRSPRSSQHELSRMLNHLRCAQGRAGDHARRFLAQAAGHHQVGRAHRALWWWWRQG